MTKMDLQKTERTIIITIGTRLDLAAIAIANWDKAVWTFEQWSQVADWQADVMAGAIEGALVIFTYMLAQRLMTNARRLKSDPEQPTRTLWAFVIFLSLLSAFCNGLYFTHFGILANPLGNVLASMIAGVVLGAAAPLLAGGIAYLQGEEAAVEIATKEAEEKREDINKRRREKREADRLAKKTEKAKIEMEKQLPEFSQWTTRTERLDMIIQCVQKLDPQHDGITRKKIFEMVFNGNKKSKSMMYQDVTDLLEAKRLKEKDGGLITLVLEQPNQEFDSV